MEFLSNEHYANLFLDEKTIQNYAVLKLYVNKENTELVEKYREAIHKHNTHTKENTYYNSGFDLFLPSTTIFRDIIKTQMVNLEVKTEMLFCKLYFHSGNGSVVGAIVSPSPFYLFPRSSFSKTPLMLANHTGIIDTGYRGNLLAAVRWLGSGEDLSHTEDKHNRLFQICHPSLCPLYVVLIDDEQQLSSTSRGEGGFGSTGK